MKTVGIKVLNAILATLLLFGSEGIGADKGKGWKKWKTVKLGIYVKTADDVRDELKSSGFNLGNWANDILNSPVFKMVQNDNIDLVLVSATDLGLGSNATRKDIFSRAKELGLKLCPAEVGPQLCLQCRDFPKNDWLLVAMEPVPGSKWDNKYPHQKVFSIERTGSELLLFGSCGEPDGFLHGDPKWVFSYHSK